MTVNVQVYEHVDVDITINTNGYTFKTPKAFGGRFYYSFCNDLDDAFQEQYPELYQKMAADVSIAINQ